jgi:hypothetical protein
MQKMIGVTIFPRMDVANKFQMPGRDVNTLQCTDECLSELVLISPGTPSEKGKTLGATA